MNEKIYKKNSVPKSPTFMGVLKRRLLGKLIPKKFGVTNFQIQIHDILKIKYANYKEQCTNGQVFDGGRTCSSVLSAGHLANFLLQGHVREEVNDPSFNWLIRIFVDEPPAICCFTHLVFFLL